MSDFVNSWRDVDEPRVKRWPSKTGEKRKINVWITTWVGRDKDATHYRVSVEEQANEYWSEKRGQWVKVNCCERSLGCHLRADVLKSRDAISLAKTFIKMIAPKGETHYVEWSWYGEGRPRWIKK